ncbi:hypothetical protein JTL96_29410, partial [Pseudomonas aeruginosa]|nr:hypothetical protein [Pseudomonas aeruginosa]MBN0846544.1 hypothetical protein [Pseudomonas aeruginosa]
KQQKRVKPFKNRCFYDSDARFSELICKIDKFARLSDFVQRFPSSPCDRIARRRRKTKQPNTS